MLAKFALEQQIMECWNIVEDLKITAAAITKENISPDRAVQVLEGLAILYQLKFEQTFNTFETVCRECQMAERDQALDP